MLFRSERGEVPCAVNLFWGFKEVTKELTELTGLPSKAGNDANVAALGEAWKGAAAGAKNVILVTLGTGVGGGIIVDGKIVAYVRFASVYRQFSDVNTFMDELKDMLDSRAKNGGMQG